MITWNESLATGVPELDEQHQRLIAAVNELEEAVSTRSSSGDLARIIRFLVAYAGEHFAGEECLMKSRRCPNHATNLRAHAEFRRQAEAWLERLEAEPSLALAHEIVCLSSVWMQAHILKIDCPILRECKLP